MRCIPANPEETGEKGPPSLLSRLLPSPRQGSARRRPVSPSHRPRPRRPAGLAKPLLLVLVLALVAAACRGDDPRFAGSDPVTRSDDGPGDEPAETLVTPSGTEIRLASALSGFSDCNTLLAHLQTAGAERIGPWGFAGDGRYGPFFAETLESGDDAMAVFDTEGGTADIASQASSPVSVEGVGFSGTNTAEADVDEADLVKTDGERVFVLADGKLTVIDAAARRVTGSLALHTAERYSSGAEMFLHGDDLLIVAPSWGSEPIEPLSDAAASLPPGVFVDDAPLTHIFRVRVAGGEPTLVEGIVVEGEYVSARSVDGVARIITRSHPERNLGFVYPASDAGNDAAERHNRQAVLDSELADWLPGYVRFDADGYAGEAELLGGCESVHAPDSFAGFGVLSVLSVAVDGAIDAGRSSAVLAPGSVVYASTESVWVATQTWIDSFAFEGDEDALREAYEMRRTSIHRFDLSGEQAAYAASGSVPGDLRDQFSMSEYDGHLRVVTTTGSPWEQSSESFVQVLREDDGVLSEVGVVGEIGKGEAVQSVRMIGDVGYVVTFRQIDPFYTLDLSDPAEPRVVGELKIPGFSSYLHPVGDGLVIGVGADADDEGLVTGAKVSVFDVSDPAEPAEVAIWKAPDGWSDVGWDHRSFLWWAPEQLAVIPLQVWATELDGSGDQAIEEFGNWAGAVLLRVDGSDISEVGRFDHDTSDEAEIGSTDCEAVGSGDIDPSVTEENSELAWFLKDPASMVVVCGPGDDAKVAGYDCHQEQWMLREAEAAGLSVADDETLLVCWLGYQMPAIGRTMVIGRDELWSVSGRWGVSTADPARVQVNDLAGLERLAAIQIG